MQRAYRKSGSISKSVSSRKSGEHKDLPLISIDEWRQQESRNLQRIQDVKVCLSFIKESIEGYHQLQLEQSKALKWERYANCDGLPRVLYPSEVRTMITEMRHYEAQNVQHTINWDLSVDERSLLSQSIYRKDLTRKTLEEVLRPDIGKIYEIYVDRILTILDRIQILLDTDFEMCLIPEKRIINILEVRSELNKEIDVIFDKLTYRIVCTPGTYKTSFDDVMESYCYRGPKYDLEIWWLRDVPIRFKYLELPLFVADMKCAGITVQIPFSVLQDNLTVRCVHTFFDHISEEAKSFELSIDPDACDVNGGLMDIEDCLINEWLMQVNIVDRIMNQLEQKIFEYEEYQKEINQKAMVRSDKVAKGAKPKAGNAGRASRASRASRSSRSERTGEGSAVKLKVPKEPERIPENMLPDPYKDFLKQEATEFTNFLETLNPKNLNLTPDEINLRQYNILGGVYSLDFVRKPKNTDFQRLNVTLHEDGRILYDMKEVRADIGPENEETNSDNQLAAAVNQAMEMAEYKDLHLNPDEIQYFCLTFRLPEHLCLFGEPVACQFIEEEIPEPEPEFVAQLDNDDISRQKKKRKKKGIDSPKMSSKAVADKGRNDPNRLASGWDDRTLGLNTLIARNSARAQSIYKPTNSIHHLWTLLDQSQAKATLQLHNFDVAGERTRPLTIQQIMDLKRHCMPRILSSFKFPMEFRLQRAEEVAERAARGCTLMRRQNVEKHSTEEEDPEFFSFEKQEAPERVYPIFEKCEPVIYVDDSSDDHRLPGSANKGPGELTDPNRLTLFDVLNTFDRIEDQYKQRTKHLIDQCTIGFKSLRVGTHDLHDSMATVSRINTRSSLMAMKLPTIKTIRTVRSSIDVGTSGADQDLASSVFSMDLAQFQKKGATMELAKEPEPESKPHRSMQKVKHWTTKNIHYAEFSPEACTVRIHTDRLGIFGFGYKCYQHFPFQKWCLQYNDANHNEIIFTLDTCYVRVILFITNAGIRGYVTKLTSEYVANPVKHFEIVEPISDWRELRRRFCERNINIFAAHDACFYIDKGYFSQKHLASELHVYDVFAVHCKLIKFYRSDWNRLAPRRVILLCLRNPKDLNEGADVTVRVTPESSTFVEVSEACTDNIEVIKLSYLMTWRNIGVYSDLHQLINSMYPQATDLRNRDPKLIHNIRTLFTQIRPLSFS